MKSYNNSCVLLFAKSPIRGQVKTRLAAQLGHDTATRLYENFVLDVLTLLNGLNVPFRICLDPPHADEQVKQWLGKEYSYAPQIGQDLGQRMRNAFSQAFSEGFNNVVIIGSDSPDLPAEYLDLAFKVLGMNNVVVGPSSDGGYYLLGFSRKSFLPEAFNNILWSTDSVFEQTVRILKRHGRNVYRLPLWHDVDTIADLKSLLLRTRNTAFEKSKTYLYLTADGSWSKPDVRL
ncbi:MAG: TIGR04282 family arsenosugar biosynthesis glycosyltransferase [Planctomycetota bacterium]|jgi:rSAM/selenodomain-associated transferase 1